MNDFLKILETCPLFAGLEGMEMPELLDCLEAKQAHATRGQIIFQEGSPAIYVGVVLSGAIRVLREDYYGNRSIVAHMGPGNIFGESFACAGVQTLPVSVVAEEDCRYLLLDCGKLTSGGTDDLHSRLIHNLLRMVAGKNLVINQKLQILSKRTTREKLMAYLMSQAKQQGREDFRIPYDRQALADYLEVDRSGLSAEIGKLRREGRLECEKNWFRLLKSEAPEQL